MPGGQLHITFDADFQVRMRGPVHKIASLTLDKDCFVRAAPSSLALHNRWRGQPEINSSEDQPTARLPNKRWWHDPTRHCA